MLIFVKADESAIVAEGVRYLRIEGAFYFGIGRLLADSVGIGYYIINRKKLL